MPDMTPVANQVIPPDPTKGINTFSGILGLKQQQQALQRGQQKLAVGQTEVQQSQQKNTELQNLSLFTQGAIKSGKYQLPDGSSDVQAFTKDAMGIAPTYGQEFIGRAASNFREATEGRRALQNLSGEQNKQISDALKGIATNPNATPSDLLDAVSQVRSNNKDPGFNRALDNFLLTASRTSPQQAAANASSALGGLAQSAPAQVDRGGSVVPGAQTTLGPGMGTFTPAGPAVGKTLAPQVATLPSGSLTVLGGAAGTGGAGGGVAAAAQAPTSKLPAMTRPSPNAPEADQKNYRDRIAQLGNEYGAVSTAANDPMNGVSATRFRNQQVLDLIPHAASGPGMRMLNTLASRLPGSTGDAYQDLEHYTAQNSAALAKLMGVPNTNLGAETAAAAAGNVERNPGALKEITHANDALNTSFDLYNRGLAKVTNNGSDMSRAAAYKQAFGQTLDINAVRWADAHRRKDQEEISSLTQKLGPDGIKAAQQRLKVLKTLSEKGDIS